MRRRTFVAAASVALAVVTAAIPRAAVAQAFNVSRRALSVSVQRVVLPNGLVVLLAPDPTVSSVAVWLTFRAGAQHAPPQRAGLAHLVEHAMAVGPTADTDYSAILERRGATWFNASTGFDTMAFETVVPAEELAVALWAAADRLVAVPPLVDAALVERHRRVILQERAMRRVDAPYGLVSEYVFRRLYAAPSPLHGGTLGTTTDLAAITAEDVRAFASALLVPANGVLAIVGRFDPATARRLVEETLGRLPPGRRAPSPALPSLPAQSIREAVEERLAHEPRVTVAWRLPNLPRDDARALQLGAQFLTLLSGERLGMDLSAGLLEYAGESLFTFELGVPYDAPPEDVQSDAFAFLRNLTHREMPAELVRAAGLALDRSAMFELDSPVPRAELLTRIELVDGPRGTVPAWLDRSRLTPRLLRQTAETYLRTATLVVHARPARARPAADRPARAAGRR